MPGSLKHSSSVRSPNFLHQKLKNVWNRIPLQQKDAPFNGELAYHTFADGLWRETKKVRSPSFFSCTSYSQVSSNTMLYFYHSS